MAINKKSSQTTKPERLIYVGPSYKNGKLLKYQVSLAGYQLILMMYLKSVRKLKNCL